MLYEREAVTKVIARPHIDEAPGTIANLLELQCFRITEGRGSLDDVAPLPGVSRVGRHSSHEIPANVETKVLQGDASPCSASRFVGDLLDGFGVDGFQARWERAAKGLAAWVGQVEANPQTKGPFERVSFQEIAPEPKGKGDPAVALVPWHPDQEHSAVCCAFVQIERRRGALLEKRLPLGSTRVGWDYVELSLKGQVRPQWDEGCPSVWSNSTTRVQDWTPPGRVT